MNKVVIWLIVVLFVISIGAGAFAIVLNGKIGTLDSETQAFKTDTASQFSTVKSSITSVDSSLSVLKSDTADKFIGVKNDITGVQNDVSGLDSNLSSFKNEANSRLTANQNSINSLNSNVTNLGTQFSESTMNVRRVYDDIIGSVCKIENSIGSGSGFIYNADGYIITCWHVINGAAQNYVTLHDGTIKSATVVGSDRYGDIAILKITGVPNLKPVPLADTTALVSGQPVIVVGNPLGIFETVTYGVISRTKGMIYSSVCGSWITNMIQYDASTNPGNSGGPVFDSNGKVIGIAAYSSSSAQGIFYAIASDKLERVANAIIDNGSFTNCILPGNWTIDDFTPATAIARGLDSTFGIIFLQATNVGTVATNDICTAIDGMAIKDYTDFFGYISLHKSVGDSVTLTLISTTGTEKTVTLTLVEGYIV